MQRLDIKLKPLLAMPKERLNHQFLMKIISNKYNMKEESNAYVLGTEKEELHRLGFQHQVWSSEARSAWNIAGFGPDQVILDLGSGPGFCSLELAYMVGSSGRIIAVDKSQEYIDHLNVKARNEGLNIETICADFHDLALEDDSLDGVYIRWALAWVEDAQTIIEKLSKALRPGGVIVVQEYYNWYTFQTEPAMPWILKAFICPDSVLFVVYSNIYVELRMYNTRIYGKVSSVKRLIFKTFSVECLCIVDGREKIIDVLTTGVDKENARLRAGLCPINKPLLVGEATFHHADSAFFKTEC